MSADIQDRSDLLSFKSPATATAVNETFQLVPIGHGESVATSNLTLNPVAEEEAVALLPADRGYHAWFFVLCSFILECLVWGFPFRCVNTWSACCSLPNLTVTLDHIHYLVMESSRSGISPIHPSKQLPKHLSMRSVPSRWQFSTQRELALQSSHSGTLNGRSP